MQRLTKRLVDSGYILRLRALPKPLLARIRMCSLLLGKAARTCRCLAFLLSRTSGRLRRNERLRTTHIRGPPARGN